jgi:putative ABC transport system permease protein
LALILAAVGLYAVLAYYVAGRRHEIGIRMALGASNGDLVELVLRRGIALVAIGLALGTAGSLALTRLLRDMLYQVGPTDLTTYFGVVVVFLLVGTVACLLPAWRALRVDPMIALQSE